MTSGRAEKRIFFALPTHSGGITSQTFEAFLATISACQILGWKWTVHCRAGDSILPQARNVLIGTFLKTDCTDLVFIDADIGWKAESFIALMTHEVDFVAGAYRFKRDGEGYPIKWLDGEDLYLENGLLEVEAVPMGFCRITRGAIERMIEARKDASFTVSDAPGITSWCLFDLEYKDGQYHGEDFVFCRRWRELGGKIWIDPVLWLSHTGTKTYPGIIGVWIKSQQ